MKKFNIDPNTVLGVLIMTPLLLLLWIFSLSAIWMIISRTFNL